MEYIKFIVVKWSKGERKFRLLGNALSFANLIRDKYNEIPDIYDEY